MNRTLLLLILFLASCADYRDRPHQDGERVHAIADDAKVVLDISFLSPNEPGWAGGIFYEWLVMLKKDGAVVEENQEIEAYIINQDMPFHPVASFIQRKKQDIQAYYATVPELKLQALDVREYPENSQCIRIYVLLEDLRSPKDNKRWSEQHALSCIFPVHQHMGYEIRYYQRYYEQHRDNQFASKADALFKSVRVEDRLVSWLRRL